MFKVSRVFLLGILTFQVVACTKGTANFSTLSENVIPMPLFAGAKFKNLVATTATQTLAVTGQCNSKIHDLQLYPVGSSQTFSTSASMTTSGLSVDCAANGTFSLTLKSLTDLGFSPVLNHEYKIEVRGVTSFGTSNPSTIDIYYADNNRQVLLTSGETSNSAPGRLATSSSFKANIRLNQSRNVSSVSGNYSTIKASSSFQMKSGAAAQND